jgi:hypothetical protein
MMMEVAGRRANASSSRNDSGAFKMQQHTSFAGENYKKGR